MLLEQNFKSMEQPTALVSIYHLMLERHLDIVECTTTTRKTVRRAPATDSWINNIHCIAICEVIDKDIRKSGSIWVQGNSDYVVTRFFCVYTSQNPGNAMNNSTEDKNFTNEIKEAIAAHA